MGSPSPSPEVSEAMVAKGAEALYDRDFPKDRIDWTGGDWHEVPQELRDIYADKARAVLTAALRLDDPERRVTTVRETLVASIDLVDAGVHQGWSALLAERIVRALGPVSPPASDPEMVERIARALAMESHPGLIWDHKQAAGVRERCREKARTLLNTTDDKEAQGG